MLQCSSQQLGSGCAARRLRNNNAQVQPRSRVRSISLRGQIDSKAAPRSTPNPKPYTHALPIARSIHESEQTRRRDGVRSVVGCEGSN